MGFHGYMRFHRGIRFHRQIIICLVLLLALPVACMAAPFNLDIDLPNTYHNANPGEDIWFTIKLLSLANTDRIDVTLNYALVDANGNVLVTQSKTVAVETQASFVEDIRVPDTAKAGKYNIGVTLNSTIGDATSKTSINVVSSRTGYQIYYIAGAIILLVLLIFAFKKSGPLIAKFKIRSKVHSIVKKRMR